PIVERDDDSPVGRDRDSGLESLRTGTVVVYDDRAAPVRTAVERSREIDAHRSVRSVLVDEIERIVTVDGMRSDVERLPERCAESGVVVVARKVPGDDAAGR